MSKIITGFPGGLKRARIKAGYKTQQEFADAFHKSLNAVQKWEQGKSKPSMDEFLELCRFFDCNADYLLCNIDEKTHDLQFICDTTGLSGPSISVLISLHEKSAIHAEAISTLITQPEFNEIIDLLCNLRNTSAVEHTNMKNHVAGIWERGFKGKEYISIDISTALKYQADTKFRFMESVLNAVNSYLKKPADQMIISHSVNLISFEKTV